MGQTCTCLTNLTGEEATPGFGMVEDGGEPKSYIFNFDIDENDKNQEIFDSILQQLLEIDNGKDKPGEVHTPVNSPNHKQVKNVPYIYEGLFKDLDDTFGPFKLDNGDRPDNYRTQFTRWVEITTVDPLAKKEAIEASIIPYQKQTSVIDLKLIHISQFGESSVSKMPSEDQEGVCYQFYEGQWRRKKFHGYGKLVTIEGFCYEGFFKQGMPESRGRIAYGNGVKLEGYFKKGVLNGKATLIGPIGEKVEGIFKDNYLDDTAVQEKYPSGAVYNGGYVDGKKNGKGILVLGNGDKIVATFVDNFIEGKTEYHYKDGKIFVGNYEGNRKSGEGKLSYPNGRFFKGSYTLGLREGPGILGYPDGSALRGNWRSGMMEGEFEYKNRDGVIRKIQFEKGELVGDSHGLRNWEF